ncbi:bifunctional proline dehydrogenase/pyrroline-5-carboxylate dehydrogenase [Sphingobacterium spiritivorum]|uniref:Bifunctional proline dehydrogenase/pyrroline-5-carboxylate dehydrogenase n=1 Tax=Sphingobacterium spiritivorum TaxID=258 RepID=A0A380CQ05_SPHSI|nr:proline dehydrogenase family protein [Sphingobacterium spiritivorum]SUJ24702.1 bifunctional proline dehydrogenase/pyrroline-5-carboxylate dehydrogenase [Sphingobacterium spiritivorum]
MSNTAAPGKLSFDNTEIAFKSKSDKDLDRAYWLFKMVASNTLIKIGTPITNFSLNIGLPIQGIIKNTIYKQFCGGETIQGCAAAIRQLGENGVGTILDYSVEGEDTEEVFDYTCEEILRTVAAAKNNPYIPFSVFKPTGLGRFELFEKVNAQKELSDMEKVEYQKMWERTNRICKACYEADIKVLVDAEHSWIQDVIDDIAREMMELYNKEKPIVYNTYQLYRHDKLASLKADFAYARTQGFYLGAKTVRGAYMEIERERAAQKGYPSPIQPTKEASDIDYNEAILFCLDNIEQIGLMAGTHNEASSLLLAEEMNKRNISHQHPHIFFAQLLGMSDNLTFNLASAGYNVAKYMPYGPVKAVMPYLFRRAQENTSVGGQTGRELSLIIKEKERRKSSRRA